MRFTILDMEPGGWCEQCQHHSVTVAHVAAEGACGPIGVARMQQCVEHEPCARVVFYTEG